jgi:hypothetical protein
MNCYNVLCLCVIVLYFFQFIPFTVHIKMSLLFTMLSSRKITDFPAGLVQVAVFSELMKLK